MNRRVPFWLPCAMVALSLIASHHVARAETRAWEETITIPTYTWQEDINPKFWALEGAAGLPSAGHGSIVYPYTMQDHLSRTKVDHTYRALCLENEYLKVICLPDLGGRIHSVLDKTQNEEMFHANHVIKPGMIAMRGAWISGGIEWNSGPHGHTVTAISPVDACLGRSDDGSVYLEIANQEKIFRTRWTVRVTLRPGRSYLEESIRLENPTDGMHPYYFWNCTAFPNRPGTRFIFPMSLGTDHNGREFFRWPIHEGRDLTWLKNYETYSSIFAVHCTHDFFGAYDVDADRGIVQWANHHELSGKKAWTWGEWEFGKVAQQNLTDTDGPYIEVQSGPLPTQSDYGMLGPHEHVQWTEWWYPVHGLGSGFDYATRHVTISSQRENDQLEMRLLATGRFPNAVCESTVRGRRHKQTIDLSPGEPATVIVPDAGESPVRIAVKTADGRVLARCVLPLNIPHVEPPDPSVFEEPSDEQATAEQLFLKGRKYDRATDRLKAREYYDKAVDRDPGYTTALRALAVLDFEAALYEQAVERLEKVLRRDGDDGLAWYYLGVCHLRMADLVTATDAAYRAARCPATRALGYDLAARAAAQAGRFPIAVASATKAVRHAPTDRTVAEHRMLALFGAGKTDEAYQLAEKLVAAHPSAIVPRALLGLKDESATKKFAAWAHRVVGEDEFELLEASLTFADMGLIKQAARIVRATCVDSVPDSGRSFMPFYYLAWYASQVGDEEARRRWLERAASTRCDRVFASRTQEIPILKYAVQENPNDGQAHLQLGCLLADCGRVDEAVAQWQKAVQCDESLSVAWRNLGLAAAAEGDTEGAIAHYRKAVDTRPDDQTLYRDLAELLITAGRRPEAIELLATMPVDGVRRADCTMLLARSYLAEKQYDRCIEVLENTPYFVNWEGQDATWRVFHQAHLERGKQHFEKGDIAAALAHFEASLTYPANLNVGRSNKPQEAEAQYWRGRALAALGREKEAKAAWRAGAEGADVAGRQNEFRQKCRDALR